MDGWAMERIGWWMEDGGWGTLGDGRWMVELTVLLAGADDLQASQPTANSTQQHQLRQRQPLLPPETPGSQVSSCPSPLRCRAKALGPAGTGGDRFARSRYSARRGGFRTRRQLVDGCKV